VKGFLREKNKKAKKGAYLKREGGPSSVSGIPIVLKEKGEGLTRRRKEETRGGDGWGFLNQKTWYLTRIRREG